MASSNPRVVKEITEKEYRHAYKVTNSDQEMAELIGLDRCNISRARSWRRRRKLPAKGRSGRPRIGSAVKRINVTFDSQTFEVLESAAEDAGYGVTDFVRAIIEDKVKRILKKK